MTTLTEQRREFIAAAKAIALRAKAAGRGLTAGELAQVNEKLDGVKKLDEQITQAKSSSDLLARIGALPDGWEEHYDNDNDNGTNGKGYTTVNGMPFDPSSGSGPSAGYLNLTAAGRKSLGNRVAGQMGRASVAAGAKALLPSGEVSTGVELVTTSPVALGKIIPGLLSVLPVVQHGGPRYQYLRQTARTNNAAPVASGGLKPTTVLGLTRITGDLVVVAHLSEAIDKYWLEDSAALQQFVGDELLYGLNLALENQVINGNGTAPNMTGLLNTSGVLVQAAIAGDLLGTYRSAVTSMETTGQNPSVFVTNPTDWARVELTKASGTGDYLIDSSPVDRAARKLWGVPIALSTSIAAGTALLLDTASVALDTDRSGIRVQWSENVSDDFNRNQLRARCEGRFGLSLYQGFGACKITLPAAA